MIVIDNILVSDEIVEADFVCNLSKCKGGCCEDGDAGAPLSDKELDEVNKSYEVVKPLMTKDGIKEVEKNGLYRYDREFGWVTPTVDDKICAYGYKDKQGIIKCVFEEAYNKGQITWKKPISCHLYPIKPSISKYSNNIMLNYEPREDMCSPACALGKELRVPVYKFLKEPIIRAYGPDFYEALDNIAQDFYSIGKDPQNNK